MASSTIPLPNGAQVAIATAFGPEIVVSGISNSAIAIATTAISNGLVDGDWVLLDIPGWPRADSQAHRVLGGATSTSFKIPGLNTLNATRFPSAYGGGKVRKITGWTQIPKIPSFERTGGDPKSSVISYLDHGDDVEFLTGSNPDRLNFSVSYAPDSAHHAALIDAKESGALQVIRLVLKNGDTLLWPGQLHYNPAPTTTKDMEMSCGASLARQGGFTRFAKVIVTPPVIVSPTGQLSLAGGEIYLNDSALLLDGGVLKVLLLDTSIREINTSERADIRSSLGT